MEFSPVQGGSTVLAQCRHGWDERQGRSGPRREMSIFKSLQHCGERILHYAWLQGTSRYATCARDAPLMTACHLHRMSQAKKSSLNSSRKDDALRRETSTRRRQGSPSSISAQTRSSAAHATQSIRSVQKTVSAGPASRTCWLVRSLILQIHAGLDSAGTSRADPLWKLLVDREINEMIGFLAQISGPPTRTTWDKRTSTVRGQQATACTSLFLWNEDLTGHGRSYAVVTITQRPPNHGRGKPGLRACKSTQASLSDFLEIRAAIKSISHTVRSECHQLPVNTGPGHN